MRGLSTLASCPGVSDSCAVRLLATCPEPRSFLRATQHSTLSNQTQVVYYLSGLTCTDENFTQKAGAQRVAAQLGLAIVAPDTSPRGLGVPGEDDRRVRGHPSSSKQLGWRWMGEGC